MMVISVTRSAASCGSSADYVDPQRFSWLKSQQLVRLRRLHGANTHALGAPEKRDLEPPKDLQVAAANEEPLRVPLDSGRVPGN